VRPLELLHQLTHDHRASGIGELLELSKMLVYRAPRAGAFERCADQQRAVNGVRDDDGLLADGALL
jgi:hypothetical protein